MHEDGLLLRSSMNAPLSGFARSAVDRSEEFVLSSVASRVKTSSENCFDPMDLHPHIPGRDAHDLPHRCRVDILQIQQHQLAVRRSELMNQVEKTLESHTVVRVGHRVRSLRHLLDFFETE